MDAIKKGIGDGMSQPRLQLVLAVYIERSVTARDDLLRRAVQFRQRFGRYLVRRLGVFGDDRKVVVRSEVALGRYPLHLFEIFQILRDSDQAG